MILLVDDPISHDAALLAVSHPNAGANLLFLGTTRQWTGTEETLELSYDCYREMAIKELNKLANEARERWQLLGVAIIHRLGVVPVGEASVAVAVSSAHRGPAYEACEWLMETLKQVVPIWKRDKSGNGDTKWVHPKTSVNAKTGISECS